MQEDTVRLYGIVWPPLAELRDKFANSNPSAKQAIARRHKLEEAEAERDYRKQLLDELNEAKA